MNPLLLAFLAVDFQQQVAPILQQQCLPCHSPAAMRGWITPGHPEQSPLYLRTQLPAGKPGVMPPGGPALTREQSQALKSWIAEGAPWPRDFTMTLNPAKRAPDDLALVRKLRERITAAEFKAYKQKIPDTGVSYEMVPISGAGNVEPFWMGRYEVTWDEYRLFMFPKDPSDAAVDAISRPTRPYVEMSFGMGINGYPAISMTQHAANKYAQWLSARTGHFYRLPTEAEWEHACRAGVPEPAPISDYAVFNADKYARIGTRKPNAWGLYDMLGNVMEWTLDGYVRGGGWSDDASRCRCGSRVASDPAWKMQDPQLPKSIWYLTDAQWLGFRLVRPLKIPTAEAMYAYWNDSVDRE